jgi:hypothetical protein
MMKNPATASVNEFNEFTKYVRDNPGTLVRLRNGFIAEPEYLDHPGLDGRIFEMRWDDKIRASWDANGKALYDEEFDMMEIFSPLDGEKKVRIRVKDGMFMGKDYRAVLLSSGLFEGYYRALKPGSYDQFFAIFHPSEVEVLG